MRHILIALLIPSCVATTTGSDPVHDACANKASEAASKSVIDRIAVQRHESSEQMTSEFIGACEGQLQADLDQVLPNLEAIADAGVPAEQDASK